MLKLISVAGSLPYFCKASQHRAFTVPGTTVI